MIAHGCREGFVLFRVLIVKEDVENNHRRTFFC